MRASLETATVTVTVMCVDDAPVAVNDAKTLDEDAAATAIDVLANDTDVDGGPKTLASVTQGTNGAVVITGGGTGLTYKPSANFCGTDSFTYTLNGGSVGTVSVTVTCVNDAPVAGIDSFSGGIQGVRMRVGSTHADTHETEHTGNVLANDTDVDTPSGLTVTPGVITSTDGGTVTMASDGSFTYDPPAGDDGSDSFSYTVEDNDTGDPDATERTATGTVTLTRAGPRVWFVDDSAPAGGRGVSHAPLQSLAPLATGGVHDSKDGTGDRIFVYSGTYTSGIDLETNQKLLGQPHGLNVNTTQLVAAGGTKPAIASATANVVALAPGTEVQDLALGNTPAGNYSLHAPAGAGAFTVADTDINNATGGALNLADGTPTVTLGTVSSNNSSGNAIRITDTDGGSVSIGTGGTLQNAANATVHVANAASSLALGASINDDVGQLVSIANSSGANTFSGAITDGNDGDGGGISLVNNDASTISFTGGLTLSTGAGEAFAATQGGTLVITGAANTIDAGGGALRVTDTTIGAGGLNFRSLRSVGGTAAGIHLHNTGSTAGLTVTGSGTPGSGGTIADKSGADGGTTGNGVLLHTTRNVSLSRMQLDDHQNHAIRGTSVTNFTLVDSVVNGANGTNPDINEGAVNFDGLLGQASITRTTISGGVLDNLRVVNSSGTLDRLTVDGGVIGLNSNATGNDGILVEAANSAVLNTTVQNTTFQGARGDHFDLNIIQSARGDLKFLNNTLSNAHANSLGGSINADASGTGDLTYLVDNNTINGAKGTAIFVGKQFGGAPGDGTAVGTISNNRVGTAGVASSGSLNGSGIEASTLARGKHSTVIANNQVRQYRDNGISLFIGGSPTSTTLLPAHDAAVNFTVTGNTVANPGSNGALAGGGLFLNAGTNSPDAYQVCLNMQNNQLSGSQPLGAGSRDIWLRQRFNSVVRMPGYTGAEHNGDATFATDITNYLTGRSNSFGTIGVSTQDTVDGGGGFFNTAGGAACPTT